MNFDTKVVKNGCSYKWKHCNNNLRPKSRYLSTFTPKYISANQEQIRNARNCKLKSYDRIEMGDEIK